MHEEFASPFAIPGMTRTSHTIRPCGRSKGSTPRGSGYDPRDGRNYRRFQLRIWVISVVLLALWAGSLLDPMVGPVLLGILMAFGLTPGSVLLERWAWG